MTIEEYRKNPCSVSSVPYWKLEAYPVPENIEIIHGISRIADGYKKTDQYFRLIHRLEQCRKEDANIQTIADQDIEQLVEMINQCYIEEGIRVTIDDIHVWQKRKTYRRNLWVKILVNGRIAASGIAEVDDEVREGMLEWIQVLPQYRGQGYGTKIVQALLFRMAGNVDFVTVSGRVDNATCPERLYRRCGFTGDDVWSICIK